MTIKPQGNRIIVKKIDKPEFITSSNIIAVSNELGYGEVMEFSPTFENIYSKGDIVIFPQGAGMGELYNGQQCLWLNGFGASDGDIWGIVNKY